MRSVQNSKLIRALMVTAMLPPSEEYPPSNILAWMKQCDAIGRSDLAQAIKNQWNVVIKRYPESRLNWPSASKFGSLFIKNNVFGGLDFLNWISSKFALTKKQQDRIKNIPKVFTPKDTSRIAIPKDDETIDEWFKCANSTKTLLQKIISSFQKSDAYIIQIKKQILSIREKLGIYLDSEDVDTIRGFSSKVDKWDRILEAYEDEVEESLSKFRKIEEYFKKNKIKYENTRITTVSFEEYVQASLLPILEFMADIKDFESQKDSLTNLSEALKNYESAMQYPTKIVSFNVENILIKLDEMFSNVKGTWRSLSRWVSSLEKTLNKFDKVLNK